MLYISYLDTICPRCIDRYILSHYLLSFKETLTFSFVYLLLSTGLAFVSKDEKTGVEDWSGCSNIKLSVFENTYKFGDYVNSFNVQTNKWVLNYVYKRLKFLNNRSISHISALMFLAVWHGFHDGYYITFFLEFIIIHFEKEVVCLYLKVHVFSVQLLKWFEKIWIIPWVLLLIDFSIILVSGYVYSYKWNRIH